MEGGGVGAEQRLELRRACQVLSATAGFFPLDGRSDTFHHPVGAGRYQGCHPRPPHWMISRATQQSSHAGWVGDGLAPPRDVLGGWAPEVVYAFTPDRNMVITISTCDGAGSNFDTKLVVFKDSIDDVVACFDDAPDACAGYRAAVRPLLSRRR